MALNQNMAADPNAIPPMSDTPTAPPAGESMATPEQIQSLWDLLDQIETKYREMNAEQFATGNQVESQKRDLVVEVFKALQDAGVDISNVEEVRKFLDELEQSNPDLYQMFVDAFNGLLGGETAGAVGAQPGVGATEPVEQAGMSGSVGATPGSAPAIPGGVPSNNGLAGMVPPTGETEPIGAAPSKRFPNLMK